MLSRAIWAVLPNQSPVLAPIGAQTVNEGQTRRFTVTASDPDGDPVALSASGLPARATFDPATGVFSWAPSYTQAGSYTVTFLASDSEGGTASQEVAIAVTDVNAPASVAVPVPPLAISKTRGGPFFTVSVRVRDLDGINDRAKGVEAVFLSFGGNLEVRYLVGPNTLSIKNNGRPGFSAGVAPGTAGTLNNGLMAINTGATTVVRVNPNLLRVDFRVRLLPQAPAGAR